MVTVYLGLGGNLGDRMANLVEAIDRLAPEVQVERVAPYYETEPWGYLDQPMFLNTVVQATTALSPRDLLRKLKQIEADLGRRPSFRNAPRPVDLDILFYGDDVVDEPDLQIPHPRIPERAFVLVPLADLAPDLLHPVLRLPVWELRKVVSGQEGVRRYQET